MTLRALEQSHESRMQDVIRYFFDLPVYRLTAARYYAERDRFVEKMMYPADRAWSRQLRKLHALQPAVGAAFKGDLQNIYGGGWEYNEIIGWLRLHFIGALLRAEYFAVPGRPTRTRTKTFDYVTEALVPATKIPARAGSGAIRNLIDRHLDACQRALRGRHLDRANLDAIARHVDWRALVNRR